MDLCGASRPDRSIKCPKINVSDRPLVNLIQDEILGCDIAYADESTLKVLEEKPARGLAPG